MKKLLVVLIVLFSHRIFAENMYGLFMVVKGDIKVQSSAGVANPAKVGTKILPGETVMSGSDSRAKIVMSDRNVINISPSTQLKIEKYSNDSKTGEKNVEMNLLEGKVRNNVEQKYDGEKNKFQIKTPTAVAGVRGTEFLTSFDPSSKITQIVTLKGAVTFAPSTSRGPQSGQAVVVKKGEMTSLSPGAATPEPPKTLPKDELRKIDKESNAQTAVKQDAQQANNEKPNKEAKDTKQGDGKSEQAKEGPRDPKDGPKDANSKDPKEGSKDPNSKDSGKDGKKEARGEGGPKGPPAPNGEPNGDGKTNPKQGPVAEGVSPNGPRSPGSDMGPANSMGPGSDMMGKEPKMIDRKDMDMGMVREIRAPAMVDIPMMMPLPIMPPTQLMPPPPPPMIDDLVRNKLNKTRVFIKPIPQ